MILDYRRKEHIPLMNRYKKVKGINLINQYLPHLNPLEKMYVIDSEEDWEKIEHEFPIDKVTARCDCPLGVNGKLPDGQTFHRDNVRGYIRDVKSAVPDGVVILQQMKTGYKASAEERCSFLMGTFLKEYLIGKHKIDSMSQVDSNLSPQDKQALFEAYVTKKKQILAVMPNGYKGVKRQILRDVIVQVIFPLYDQRETLARNGLKHFGVEMNVIQDGTLVPLELAIGARFIQKGSEKKTLLSKLTEER